MATQEDVRRIALSLPEVQEIPTRFGFTIRTSSKPRDICWVWLERIHPKKARIPNPEVLAVRVADLDEKAALLAMDEEKFFTEPHYNGYPAILVRLAAIDTPLLEELITSAWRCMAPKSLSRDSLQ